MRQGVFIALTALAMVCHAKAALNDDLMLKAIGTVETNMNHNAIGKRGERGAYQLKHGSWLDAQPFVREMTVPWSSWRCPLSQKAVAEGYLVFIKLRLISAGIYHPTPEHIAVCWNKGFSKAKESGFRPNDYAIRVGNIYRLQSH